MRAFELTEILLSDQPEQRARHDRWLLGLAIVVSTLHMSVLGGWVVDDAFISFAYARNFADGLGLVSQPGAIPVEGFSNPLWVLVWSLIFRVTHIPPVWLIRAVSLLLVSMTLLLFQRSLRLNEHMNTLLANVPLLFCSMSTPFIVWCASGLENPLYVVLLTAALYRTLVSADRRCLEVRGGMAIGALLAAASLTRPEGLLFGMAPLITTLLPRPNSSPWSSRARQLIGHVIGFVVPVGAYLLFRYRYFGELVPNTYYAKRGPDLGSVLYGVRTLASSHRASVMLSNVIAPGAAWLVCAAAAGLALSIWRRRASIHQSAWCTYATLTIANFALMPNDWMKEWRFATPVVIFVSGWLAASLSEAPRLWCPGWLRCIASAAIGVAVAGSAVRCVEHTKSFAASPTMPVTNVFAVSHRLSTYSKWLGLEQPMILTPDVGGILFLQEQRVLDMAGLVDAQIARDLVYQRNLPHFFHYIFEERKPTFILHKGGYWSDLSQLGNDSRLGRDYVLVSPSDQPNAPGASGLYVRRDCAVGKADILERMREMEPRR